MIISVSGVDCSGKSTQLGRLENHLSDAGYDVTRFWFRPGYWKELDWFRALVRRFRPELLPRSGSPSRKAAFQRASVRRSWLAMAIVDMLLQYGVKLRVMARSGRIVLCDRYLHDAVLDLRLRFPELRPALDRVAGALSAVLPTSDCSLLMTLPHDEMVRRMAFKAEPFPDPPEMRDARYLAYERLASSDDMITIDAARPIDTVFEDVLQQLRVVCGFPS